MIRKIAAKFKNILEKKLESINRIEIDGGRILNNYETIVESNGEKEIWPVLKANAYGHGIKNVVKILDGKRFAYVVVDSYYEALKVWEVDFKRKVLLIGPLLESNYKMIDWRMTTIMVQTFKQIEELGRLKSKIKIHLKINTGMNRQGFDLDEIKKAIELIKANKNLELEGVMSHFANADEKDESYSLYQEEKFQKAYTQINKAGLKVKYWHLAATAGSVRDALPFLNAVRLGVGLYGHNPISSSLSSSKSLAKLKPALRMFSKIIKVRKLSKGEKVSYGGIYTASRDSWIGLVPIGYYEGLDRRLSNNHWMKYRDNYYPVAGRICMNMCLIDFGSVVPNEGDEIEVYGYEGKNSVEESAKREGIIVYELLVKLSESVRRVII